MTCSPLQVEVEHLEAKIDVRLRDPKRAESMAAAIRSALTALEPIDPELANLPRVTVRTRKGAASRKVAGTITIIHITNQSARFLLEIVEALRTRQDPPRGIQLVWDGHAPERSTVERHVFAVLERVRATPSLCPTVLTPNADPSYALTCIMNSHSLKKEEAVR